jgi:acetyl esterase/lipase
MRVAALVLVASSAAAAVIAVLPSVHINVWYARLAARELATFLAAGTLAALVLAAAARRPWLAAGAALTILVHLAPVAAVVPVYRERGTVFSWREHLRIEGGSAARVEYDVVLEASRPDLRTDLYLPSGPGPHPLVVVVHGGSWRRGEKGQVPKVSHDLAARGFVVADVGYRLAPQHPFPAAVLDVKCLAGRLRERLQSTSVTLLGRSAGGQVALVAAYSAGDPKLAPACAVADTPPDRVVALYAPTDLVWGHANPITPDVVDGTRSLELYLGGTPAQVPDAYRRGTPQSWARPGLPPTLLVHGTAESMVRPGHATKLEGALRGAGVPVEVLLLPGADHGFDVRFGGLGEQLARDAILRFVRP